MPVIHQGYWHRPYPQKHGYSDGMLQKKAFLLEQVYIKPGIFSTIIPLNWCICLITLAISGILEIFVPFFHSYREMNQRWHPAFPVRISLQKIVYNHYEEQVHG